MPEVERRAGGTALRYIAVSVAALALDTGCYLALIAAAMAPAAAAALGYALGVAAHWWGSSRQVFVAALAAPGAARRRQQALFVASALMGLAVTVAVVALATRLGLGPRPAKALAVVASCAGTWAARSRWVFAVRRAQPAPA